MQNLSAASRLLRPSGAEGGVLTVGFRGVADGASIFGVDVVVVGDRVT